MAYTSSATATDTAEAVQAAEAAAGLVFTGQLGIQQYICLDNVQLVKN